MVASIAIIIVGAAAFYGGTRYEKRQSGQQFSQRAGMMRNGQGAIGGARVRNGGFIGGEVIKMDEQSMTVKLADGGSKLIFVADNTSILKSASGTKADLSVGTNITANGTVNADGSITAQSVQIRPAGLGIPEMRRDGQLDNNAPRQ